MLSHGSSVPLAHPPRHFFGLALVLLFALLWAPPALAVTDTAAFPCEGG